MQPTSGADTGGHIGFFLVPNFSMIAVISAIEALRLANRTSERQLYTWEYLSIDGEPVMASNGMSISAERSIEAAGMPGTVFVCGGIGVTKFSDRRLEAWLRRLAQHGKVIGGMCTGAYLLARAGLLDGYTCTIHWENLAALGEEFPDLTPSYKLFEIDRKRLTCAGGTASLDLMLNLIALQHGYDLAAAVSDQLIHERIRDEHDHQRMTLHSRLRVSHPKLLSVVARMEAYLEEPLSCSALAAEVGLSTRQLERLFRRYFDCTPTRYYLDLRLKRARHLLSQTSMPILEVALASGFISASHFSKCYREHFGKTPREERRLVRWV